MARPRGQITKLKLLMRQMYGRASLDLLRASALRRMISTRKLHQNIAEEPFFPR
jgi:hypothetical protein